MFAKFFSTTLLLVTLSTLAACESSEEKAEEYFQSGLVLREAGDLDRAAVEFRNVFRYDGTHRQARENLAEIMTEQGKTRQAYRQYLHLAEQYPEVAEFRRELALIALDQREWAEAERHGTAAMELDPNAAGMNTIRMALAFRQAVLDEDAEARAAQAQVARDLLQDAPENMIARQIVIAEQLDSDTPEDALIDIDSALSYRPDSFEYSELKLRLLARIGNDAQIEAHLRKMLETFPDNEEVQESLIQWYVEKEDFDRAEDVLRGLAGDDTAETAGHMAVIGLIDRIRGREAALEEIDRLIDANAEEPANRNHYRALRATLLFEDGNRDTGIAQIEDILEDAAPSAQTRQIKGTLARMLLATGNVVGARALVEEILEEDATDVTARKLRGAMLIDDDRTGDAIVDLRAALDQDPQDTEIILLLADAHLREGNPELAGERLATAVEVSNSAPQESLRYAAFLLERNRRAVARSLLADARAATPDNIDILVQSARLALQDDALPLVQGIVADLERLGDDRADQAARSLRAALLLRQDRLDEGLALLEGQVETAENAGEDAGTVLAIVRTRLQAGEIEAARTYLDGLLETTPDDPALRLINAALTASEGDLDGAETILRQLIDEDPTALPPVQQLYQVLIAQGKAEEATDILDRALEEQPEARSLMLLKAARLERDGNLDGAIEIYETLYDQSSSDVLVANNLASLLTTHRDDAESLARAATVARRLRSSDIAPFQDTYGWIAYRQGDFEEALTYLDSAARALPNNALVQYHLGKTLAALDRTEEASETLRRAVELAGDSPLPQFEDARTILAELDTAASGGGQPNRNGDTAGSPAITPEGGSDTPEDGPGDEEEASGGTVDGSGNP